MRSTTITKAADITKKWYVVDAQGKTLGRLATEVAKVLRGKHKPTYQPNADVGDYVIIINAEKITVSGNKMEQKQYFRHTGWVGGDRLVSMKVMMAKKPTFAVSHAIKGMLPKGVLGRSQFKKLHVYAGSDHKHQAQMPEILEFDAKGIKS